VKCKGYTNDFNKATLALCKLRTIIKRSLGLMLFLYASLALAHQPYWNESSPTPEQAFVVENVTISKALFGNLAADEVDYFRLELPDNFIFDSSLFVGESCSEGFQPRLYLLSAKRTGGATFAMPKGYGAVLGTGDWKPFSTHGLVGREGPTINELLLSGTYYLVVQANEASGFYLVSLSGSESFGGGEGGLEAIPRFNACQ
jgi:hypothetical protein